MAAMETVWRRPGRGPAAAARGRATVALGEEAAAAARAEEDELGSIGGSRLVEVGGWEDSGGQILARSCDVQRKKP
jgi:hypothetical protein